MYGTQMTDKGLAALAKLKTLEELSINHSNYSDASTKILANFQNLRKLDVHNTNITDQGLPDLGRIPNLTSLEIRNGVFGKVSPAGLANFRQAHPKCEVKGP
jgi:hypothetical protein